MKITIHLPPVLLAAVDRRAKVLGLSRSAYIRRSLEKTLVEETEGKRPGPPNKAGFGRG